MDIFEEVRSQIGVSQVVRELTGQEVEPGRFGICPICESDRLQITRENTGWSCWAGRCHEKRGRDTVGMAAAAWDTDRAAAAKRLLGADQTESGRPARQNMGANRYESEPRKPLKPKNQADKFEPWQVASWQAWLGKVVRESQAALADPHDETSRRARLYLCRERGLAVETVKAAGIGLNRHWVISHEALPGEKVSFPPGIVIPWKRPGGYAGAMIRQFHEPLPEGRRYQMVTGSRRRWMFPGPDTWAYTGPLLITEGEFDALAAQEALAGLCAVKTIGSSTSGPDALDGAEKLALSGFTKLLIAADGDAAGQECRAMWAGYSRRAVSLTLPDGFKDLNEARAAGGDLRGWYMSELKRLGIDPGFEPGVDIPERGAE